VIITPHNEAIRHEFGRAFTRLMALYGLDEAITAFDRPVFGTCAGMIVLDRNFLDIPAEQIADIKVLQTVVGGQVVYQSDRFAPH